VPHPQAQSEEAAAAGAEDAGGRKAQRMEQRRGIVGLLIERGRGPAGGSRAASVSAPVVRDDLELAGEVLRELLEMAAVAGRAHDEEHGWPVAVELVVQLSSVHGQRRHRPIVGHTPP